jgi:hypothetical protein
MRDRQPKDASARHASPPTPVGPEPSTPPHAPHQEPAPSSVLLGSRAGAARSPGG